MTVVHVREPRAGTARVLGSVSQSSEAGRCSNPAWWGQTVVGGRRHWGPPSLRDKASCLFWVLAPGPGRQVWNLSTAGQ